MLSSPIRTGPERPGRLWQTVSAADAVRLIRPGTTLGIGWLSDALGSAMAQAFLTHARPNGLSLVYAATQGNGRAHGLNLLAHEGLVRRVVGGQWHPVPALQALAGANRIEAYSLPAGVIGGLFRDIAAGLLGHLSRSGLGTSADPRQGGGRLNQRTREDLVRLVRPGGEEALFFQGFQIDVAIVGLAFMAGTAAIAMSRDSAAIVKAARKGGGIVIGQANRIGTLDKLGPNEVLIPDTSIDAVIAADPGERNQEVFSPATVLPIGQRRLPH